MIEHKQLGNIIDHLSRGLIRTHPDLRSTLLGTDEIADFCTEPDGELLACGKEGRFIHHCVVFMFFRFNKLLLREIIMKEQTEVGKLKEGRYMVIDDEPCKIMTIATSKPGKHGAAKARIMAVGIFDGVKRDYTSPDGAKIYAPIVERKSAQVISIAANTVSFMDMKDYTNFELNVTDDQLELIEPGKEIPYIESLGKRKLDI